MKYIILKNNASIEEIKSRQDYIKDIFCVYTIPFYYDDYIELKSIPESFGDIIFLNGHNNQVYDFLVNKKPKEKNIIMITCYFGMIKNLKFHNKKMFCTNTITFKFSGKEYGFDFEITNSELNLYNCPYKSLEDKINYSFERVS